MHCGPRPPGGERRPGRALTDEIAYGCDVDICLVQPDVPGSVTNLTDNGSASIDAHPAWSPDGTRVAFVSTFGGGAQNIFVMEPDAPVVRVNLATQLTHYPAGSVSITNPCGRATARGSRMNERLVRRRPACSSSPPTGRPSRR